MKKIIIIIQILFLNTMLNSQETGAPSYELFLDNPSSYHVTVHVYPISMIINGDNEYNLEALEKLNHGNYTLGFDYVNGVRVVNGEKKILLEIQSGHTDRGFNYDAGGTGTPNTAEGTFGRGVYKITYRYTLGYNTKIDSVKFEQDGGANYDMRIRLRDNLTEYGGGTGPGLTYQMTLPSGPTPEKSVSLVDGYIKMWDPYPYITNAFRRSKDFENFNYGSGNEISNLYNEMPLDSRIKCNLSSIPIEQNQEFPYIPSNFDLRQGTLTLNLSIRKNIQTQSTYYSYSNENLIPIIITDGANLKIEEGTGGNPRTLKMIPVSTLIGLQGTDLIVNSGGWLWLQPSSSTNTQAIIEVQNKNKIDVKTDGRLILHNHSKIEIINGGALYLQYLSRVVAFPTSIIKVYAGGLFCNYGAYIAGRLTIQYQGGFYSHCAYYDNIVYDDSTKVILTDGAIFEVPDNMTLYFRDPETVLQMDSNSTIKLGENSKLVFQNGARINAYKANFISSNPNSTWDGIYFEDNANDTIRFCTIENALSGVNIYDRNDVSGETPGTEISNCTFRNSTGNPLTSGIYALNSNNILISNNTFESPYVDIGFSNGILLEYCPSGNINIIENDIDYSTYGITVIQSSPYIARNTITGRTNSNYGIFLDNSGGTIKYNTVNNFNSSLVANYSSPYVFRNSFANASERNVELRNYSVPIMKPIISEPDLYWLGGNNTISGSPSTSGIAFYEESYPEIDEGYNIDDVNGADYMIGDVPTVLDRTLYATINNWGDEIPDPNLFNVQEGTVDYEPTYDGVTPIQYNDYELYDIGFDLYDTVYTKDLGDSPGGSTLFMQAYNKEMQHEYINAISLYKQVIINYRKSYFAVASVARILNCIEKAKGNIGQYLIHQNYLNQIRNNPNIPFVIKELAEDYIIKCKVKRGLLDEAISDYQFMYQQNQNNSKGFHALINKEIILSMKRDTSDNPVVTSTYDNIVHHKYNLFALLSGNNQNHLKSELTTTAPTEYKLSQNYPNPFNPVTSIQYELPNDVFVTIKVYDILGKEVAVLVNGFNKAGRYIVSFNGSGLSSGIYFYKIEAGAFKDIKRMVLVK